MTAQEIGIREVRETGAGSQSLIGLAERAMLLLNAIIMVAASVALLFAGLVLSYSVAARYFFNAATYWQDEAAVFLLVGSTFMSAAYVQSKRGHIGIEAIVGLLPPRVNRIRSIVVDVVGFLFCTFFAWKSWTLFHEAWVDGQVSSSTWAPPQWIPYSFMALGMSLMSVQIFLQIAIALDGGRSK
ncbi:TRAP transporter small permease [Afipia sp. GAS231]|uniref:TRAP transporter small permease n=1 Tax=Afipia sp. GAS231 TaxID=1882747 RepID=UPI00087D0E22|nr:TRAP transporter small permease [Afipia sp. GAS231]SDP31631.1 TRAP-type C4-dicarboxylate transport system, small permease component [Afipia sp. GAS231]